MNDFKETIFRMRREIISDCWYGRVPADVSSFGELHDFRDANCYGGFCDDDYEPERDTNGDMTQAQIDFFNTCQEDIDDWIKTGGLRRMIQLMYEKIKDTLAGGTVETLQTNSWYWARKYQALRNATLSRF